MAQINNSVVIQKLIDELQLYPGKDLIPSEIADKIIPTFQVNSEEITFKTNTANVVRGGITDTASNVYVVPATGKFYLTNVSLQMNDADPDTAHGDNITLKVDIDGSTQTLIHLHNESKILSSVGSASITEAVVLNLQNPILLDQSSNIEVTGTATTYACYSIVGYTEQ